MDPTSIQDLTQHLSNLSTSSLPNSSIESRCTELIGFIDQFSKIRTINPEITNRREGLPIFKKKQELIQAIKDNPILIVIGETGSGKTTQLPQYIAEGGLAVAGKVGCTQLRRMAAKAVAERVSKEYGCELGTEVGYTIRFEDVTSPSTKIQYMTDGILLRECIYDPLLSTFSVIILDESHERTIDTDVLLAVLRSISQKRKDLRLIISSATLDANKFSEYFFNAKIFQINGRMFPVEIKYSSRLINEYSYVEEAFRNTISINEKEDSGDILIFMSGEDDIENLVEMLEYHCPNRGFPGLTVIPVYSSLPWEQQALLFEKAQEGYRKVIVATNIAETALTVDGIRYVIDSGFVKQKVRDSRKRMDVLKRIRISQAQAIQRAGRAGRLSSGKCYRLYTESEFNNFVKGPIPEILRSSLTNAVLLLKQMGYNDLSEIEFLDAPPQETLQNAIEELCYYEAIDENGAITEIGRKMAGFPLDPNLAKMLIVSEKLGCSEEMLTVVAMVSVPQIFVRRKKNAQRADAAKAKFFTSHGDLVMLMNIYKQWSLMNGSKEWCKTNFLNGKLLDEAHFIRKQIEDVMRKRNMRILSCYGDMVPVLKSICSGFFQNLAYKRSSSLLGRNQYQYVTFPKEQEAYIHPSSALFTVHPQIVVYQKLIMTKKPYMLGLSPTESTWMREYTSIYKSPQAKYLPF